MTDLKLIYQAIDKEEAAHYLEVLVEKWKKKHAVITGSWQRNQEN